MAAAAVQVRITLAIPEVRVARAVLVIEDEIFVSKGTCSVLVEHGHSVLWARNLREAGRILRRHGGQIAAIVCDAVLPDGSGIDLVESCRRESSNLKFVVVSGYPKAMLPGGLAEQSDAIFLTKPYSSGRLIKSLESALNHQNAPERVA